MVKAWYGRQQLAIDAGIQHVLPYAQLNHLESQKYLAAALIADGVMLHKPAPATFLCCAELLDVMLGRCRVSEEADLHVQAAAHYAGVDTVDIGISIG